MSAQVRGLARLMLRFPELRNQFARLQGGRFRGICEEYDLVWEMLTLWSPAARCAMFSLEDYRRLASSIEDDAVMMAENCGIRMPPGNLPA